MGNRESSPLPPTSVEHKEPVDIHTAHYKELYDEFTTPGTDGAPVDRKTFRDQFVSYFGGPCQDFGQALYAQLFPAAGDIDELLFVRGLRRLRKELNTNHVVEKFLFSAFSHNQETITKEELTALLHTAANCAMVVGSELHDRATLPRDYPLLTALSEAAWAHADSASMSQSQFVHWASGSCPGLLDGIREWVTSLLTHDSGQVSYQLPTPNLGKDPPLEREIEQCCLVWLLSTAVPMIFMGHKAQGSKDKGKVGSPVGGEWTCLYSSDRHGLSMNRFQHHCSDYKHPSVLILSCYQREEKTPYQFAIALDTEWRDGMYCYGGEESVLLQIRPTFRLLRRGPKLVSLNEKQRGFPTGLRVTQTNGSELLVVDSALNQANFLGAKEMCVECVEVWGCGGVEAVESQRRMKEWEKRQILLRRKVKRERMAEAWESSPDRYLLELGGVTTRRPTEQQQQ